MPVELIIKIFEYFDCDDQRFLSFVCKDWTSILKDPYFYHKRCQYYGIPIPPASTSKEAFLNATGYYRKLVSLQGLRNPISSPVSLVVDRNSKQAYDGEKIYILLEDRIKIFDTYGKQIQTIKLPSQDIDNSHNLYILGENLIITSNAGIVCYSSKTNSLLWISEFSYYSHHFDCLTNKYTVLAYSNSPHMHFILDHDTGSIINQIPVSDYIFPHLRTKRIFNSQVLLHQNNLYYLSDPKTPIIHTEGKVYLTENFVVSFLVDPVHNPQLIKLFRMDGQLETTLKIPAQAALSIRSVHQVECDGNYLVFTCYCKFNSLTTRSEKNLVCVNLKTQNWITYSLGLPFTIEIVKLLPFGVILKNVNGLQIFDFSTKKFIKEYITPTHPPHQTFYAAGNFVQLVKGTLFQRENLKLKSAFIQE